MIASGPVLFGQTGGKKRSSAWVPVPVTRLLCQSPAGLSAKGESDTRNSYDMIAARQELDLRPQLERLDRLILRSEGLDPTALTFAFRPLWQLDAPAQAALALTKAQATQIYVWLGLWPAAVTARLAQAQIVADGTYPNAAAVFAEAENRRDEADLTLDFDPAQLRDPDGRWTTTGGGGMTTSTVAPEGVAELEAAGLQEGSGAEPWSRGVGPHAPDGTPITLAASKGRSRALARVVGAMTGMMGRLLRRWWPEEGEKSALLPEPGDPIQAPPSSPSPDEPSNLTMQDLARVTRGFAGRKSAQKWLNQMNDRGWTPEQIEEAITHGQ